jgi:hypothetical protein
MDETTAKNRQAILDALACGSKRTALALEVGVSEGQLSKLLSGELLRFAHICAALGLRIYSAELIDATWVVQRHLLDERSTAHPVKKGAGQ